MKSDFRDNFIISIDKILPANDNLSMVSFVGAGPGAVDLITIRGLERIKNADCIIFAGSLVNPDILKYCDKKTSINDSSKMTLEDVISLIKENEKKKLNTVRLHTGDPCLYGTIKEQMEVLDKLSINYEYIPGVSSFCAAAAALNIEYTLPEISQSVIITRMQGKTAVPSKESIRSFAFHNATMVIFLSASMTELLQNELILGGYAPNVPAAIVYKASWPCEKTFLCTVGTLYKTAKENNINKTALILVGEAIKPSTFNRSKLYDPSFTTEYRQGI